jgi:hypothetical protein
MARRKYRSTTRLGFLTDRDLKENAALKLPPGVTLTDFLNDCLKKLAEGRYTVRAPVLHVMPVRESPAP